MNTYFELNVFDFFHLTTPAYSFFSCIGLLFMMLVMYFRLEKTQMCFKDFLFMIGFLVIGVGIGSKFVFILTKIPDIINNFSFKYLINTIITSGFVFYGGLFGAIIFLKLFCMVKKMDYKAIANLVIPSFPLFHCFGRIGCFFAGCCYGKVATWGFALETEPDIQRVPVQLFESIILFFIFLILLFLEKNSHEKKDLLSIYLLIYAVSRFGLEFLRGDAIRGIWFGLSTSQWISISIVVGLFIRRMKWKESKYEEEKREQSDFI